MAGEIRIPEGKYIQVLEGKLSQERARTDQQEAVILGLMEENQTLREQLRVEVEAHASATDG